MTHDQSYPDTAKAMIDLADRINMAYLVTLNAGGVTERHLSGDELSNIVAALRIVGSKSRHLAPAQTAPEPLSSQAVREDERLACWKIADQERTALKNADPTKAAWLVAFDIANSIKARGYAITSTNCGSAK